MSRFRRFPPTRVAALGLVAVAAASIAACGHQVTPEPQVAGNLSGHVSLRFDTVGTLNFGTYSYAVILNTCGSGQVPYPNPLGTSFLNYSYGFFVGGSTSGTAQVSLYEFYYNGGNPAKLLIPLNPSTIQFNPNSNGLGTEFTLIFPRSVLDHFGLQNPCPNVTQPPATPGTAPSAQPTTLDQSTWVLNYMTFDTSGVPQDSLGRGGATDNTFPGIRFDVNATAYMPIFRQTPLTTPNNQSAQIAGGEVDNFR